MPKPFTTLMTLASVTFLGGGSVYAQIIPDSTLGGENSSVSGSVDVEINGGAQRGGNLFHSFEQFSIPEASSAYFNNLSDVQRIFTRVTGNSPSVIDGLIEANGTADLYIINPAGISFLPNAALNIGGSFIGTTANIVNFADGRSYPTALEEQPLFTSSVPVGLGFSSQSSISVLNSGHTLEGNLSAPLAETAPSLGLAVLSGKTIALLGGEIVGDGSILRAPNGRVELGAVREGIVSTDAALGNFDYQVVSPGDIQLSQLSLLDTRGATGGSIAVTAEQVALETGSVLYTSSLEDGLQPTSIDVAAESLTIDGPASDFRKLPRPAVPTMTADGTVTIFPVRSSGLLVDNYGAGVSGDITIAADNLSLADGGLVYQRSFASGAPGNVLISSQSVSLAAPDPTSPGVLSAIASTNFGPTAAQNNQSVGRILIDTENLTLLDGGFVSTSTIGSGAAGDIYIDAENILISSVSTPLLLPSSISSASLLAGPSLPTGDTGDIEVNANSLRILNGGTITNSSNSLGDAGSITVRANEFIEIDGNAASGTNSQISSEAILLSQPVRDFFNLQSNPTGNAGEVYIETPSLTLSNGGEVAVENQGSGDAGEILINSDSIRLLSSGQIVATTNGGNGGNIDLMASSLFIADGSITTSASGQGNGGNILIDSDAVALLGDSTVSANAEQGAGGQVAIQTDVLLRAPTSAITATSAAGPQLDGAVEIQAPDDTPRTEPDVAPSTVNVPSIAVVCSSGGSGSEFSVTGTGGRPLSAEDAQRNYAGWNPTPGNTEVSSSYQSGQIVEAQGWISNGDGTVRFTDQVSPAFTASSAREAACTNRSA